MKEMLSGIWLPAREARRVLGFEGKMLRVSFRNPACGVRSASVFPDVEVEFEGDPLHIRLPARESRAGFSRF